MALLSQFSAITGRPRRRRYGPIVSARAAHLPDVYRQRVQEAATQEELDIAREGLGLDYARLRDEQKEAKKAGLIGVGQLATSAGLGYARIKDSLGLPKLFGGGTTATAGTFPAATTAMASPWETSPMLLAKTGTGAGAGAGTGILAQAAPYALPISMGLLVAKGIADTFGRKKERREAFRKLRRQYGQQFDQLSPEQAQSVVDEWLEGRGPLEEGSSAAMEAFYGRFPDIYQPALALKQQEWKAAGRITGPPQGSRMEVEAAQPGRGMTVLGGQPQETAAGPQLVSPYASAMKRIMQGRQ